MIPIVRRHLSINRILLIAIGLWPYQRSKLVFLQATVFSFILWSFIVFQLTNFVASKCTMEMTIMVLSFSLKFTVDAIFYNLFWYKIETVKYILAECQHAFEELKDKNEIAIIDKYGTNAKRFTIRITALVIFCIFGLAFIETYPNVFNFIKPITDIKSFRLPIKIEYFLDREKYYYIMLLHMNAAIAIGLFTVLAAGLMIRTCFQYICGMFEVASYRIEQAMATNMLQNINIETERMIRKQIIYAVNIQCKAMRITTFLISDIQQESFILTIITVICLSLNLYKIFQLVSTRDINEQLLIHFVIVCTCFIYVFLTNYVGQEIMDINNNIFTTAYNVQWYRAPLKIQKIILFLLERSCKTFSLQINSVITASLETFLMIFNTCMSYCTVLYSIQR